MTKNEEKSQPFADDTLSCAALVVAAGRGRRAGGDIPKQYQPIAGKPLLRLTVETLRRLRPDMPIAVVYNPADADAYHAAVAGVAGLLPPIAGGAERQDSVRLGLEALASHSPDIVYVHDAARPFLTAAVLDRLDGALLDGAACALPALPVVDTLKRQSETGLTTLDRAGLLRAQTPQAARYGDLLAAHQQHRARAVTDDAALMELAGHAVTTVTGSESLFKVTGPRDFQKAETYVMMQLADIRTATGFDVHRFAPGNSVRLCGVDIAHTASLKGHSDADVGMHALTDALFAALVDGDIGAHFPPTDDTWKDRDSADFLDYACVRLRDRGGVITHASVTMICERPKIGPHRNAMRQHLADIMAVDISRVSIQATTTETLGFTGRSEGIAAQASVTIRLPFDGLSDGPRDGRTD